MSSRITVTYRSCSYIHTCDHTYTLSCIKDECVCVCILHYRTVCMYLVLIHPAVCVCMFIWMFSDPCKLPVTLGIAQHCSINIHCTLINLVSSVVRTQTQFNHIKYTQTEHIIGAHIRTDTGTHTY